MDELEQLVRDKRWKREWLLRHDNYHHEWDVFDTDFRFIACRETAVEAARAALETVKQ